MCQSENEFAYSGVSWNNKPLCNKPKAIFNMELRHASRSGDELLAPWISVITRTNFCDGIIINGKFQFVFLGASCGKGGNRSEGSMFLLSVKYDKGFSVKAYVGVLSNFFRNYFAADLCGRVA